ncbi:hypothetical protein [Plantactinospora soyae]|uniref:Uncharacterized protein n=1 Tax=Plantactinospora soyae TaxID=1544732 RepID=A0A927R5E9_9ACTN|nr:hypothetical protein [Plantactinospora soyae]MBE1485866.1 hypothetical protein [Plantactinospora soyae]
MILPSAGDLVLIDGRASVQFAGDRALRMRVQSVDRRPTYYGWCWITGYVLDQYGDAVDRREVYVQIAGLRRLVPRTATRAWVGGPPRPDVRPAGAGATTPPQDQAAVHRATTYPQRGSLV